MVIKDTASSIQRRRMLLRESCDLGPVRSGYVAPNRIQTATSYSKSCRIQKIMTTYSDSQPSRLTIKEYHLKVKYSLEEHDKWMKTICKR